MTQLAVADRTMGAAPPEGAGWYYDDFTCDTIGNGGSCGDVRGRCGADGQRIAYTRGHEPITGTVVRLECLQPVQQIPGVEAGAITIGSACSTGCGAVAGGLELTCDPQSNTCQQTCGSDADCSARDLVGWKCNGAGFCQNPTCG